MAEWVQKVEYARRYGLSKPAITKAVKTGRLPEKDGKVDAEVDIRRNRMREPANEAAPDNITGMALTEQIQRAKLAQLKADTVLKTQKDTRTREEWRRQDMEDFSRAFAETFAPVKKRLIELRLSSEQLVALRTMWEECWAAFAARIDAPEVEIESE